MYLIHVSRLCIPPEALAQTQKVLRAYGEHGYERLVLWAGTIDGSTAAITRVIVPEQNSVRSESGVGYFVEQHALFRLSQFLRNEKLRLIAQVHSHPSEAYHSDTDDRYAIVTEEGGFSLVVPDFARGPMTLDICATYRLAGGSWIKLQNRVVRDLFFVE